MTKSITVQNTNHEEVKLTYFDKRLVMIHSDQICAQWEADHIGVELINQGKGIVKLGFMSTLDQGYQSFYFTLESHETLNVFFKELGYPMPESFTAEEMDSMYNKLESEDGE